MKYILIIVSVFTFLASDLSEAQTIKEQTESYLTQLGTIDPEVQKLFPRWIICEPELQIQIRRAFVLAGYNKSKLDENKIEVIAIPKGEIDEDEPEAEPYRLLHIKCGTEGMNGQEIRRYMRSLEGIIAGEERFLSKDDNMEASRDYCYEDIPPDISLTESQKKAIVDFFEPTNKTHSMSISFFEQSLKIGETGFWLKNIIGNDDIGYPFWAAGESKVIVKKPLYKNTDHKTSRSIPELINFSFGFAYNYKNGLDNNNGILGWVPQRQLNNFPGGKVLGAIDFSLPFHPRAGVHFDVEIPLTSLDDEDIKAGDFYYYETANPLIHRRPPADVDVFDNLVAPVLRETGRFSLFYNFWFPEKSPENFLRVDLGISYAEIREMAIYEETKGIGNVVRHLYNNDVEGLTTYKPSELGDWLFLKAEYRNMAGIPFGVSLQYSNQILLGRGYFALFSDWLLLELKLAKTLRNSNPFEKDIFFMVSPVIRLTI